MRFRKFESINQQTEAFSLKEILRELHGSILHSSYKHSDKDLLQFKCRLSQYQFFFPFGIVMKAHPNTLKLYLH